jgi:hypothetical protein
MPLATSLASFVAEIPAKAEWCELRKIVLAWTQKRQMLLRETPLGNHC